MRELFQRIISEYRIARKQHFAGHPLANFIRKELRIGLKDIVNDEDRYLVHSSPGQGGWTDTPWIAIFDIFKTKSAQEGFYPVFIFRDDMSGFYLTLNQGVTIIREEYKKSTVDVLKIRASDFRARIGKTPSNFSEIEISLRLLSTTKSDLAKDYEAGNIVAKFYRANNLPADSVFTKDILEMLEIYRNLIYDESEILSEEEQEADDSNSIGYEKKQYRQHRRIERNQSLIRKVKNAQGYICKACELNFIDKYGNIGQGFIEAHHLKPISQLTADIVELDARKDFIVLCSNCHRMIHRTPDPSDLEAFKLHIKPN